LRLAVDEVIHHHDVLLIVIPPRARLAGRDPHPGDKRVVEHDTEEGQAPIAGRGRDEAGEEPMTMGVEVLDLRTMLSRLCLVRLVGLVDVREDRAEAGHRCRRSSIGARHEEESLGEAAAYRSEQARSAEGAEDVAVGRIVEERGQARRGSLRKARPRRGEPGPASVQEGVERCDRVRRVGRVALGAVPVDLTATDSGIRQSRPGQIEVVWVPQSGAVRVDRALNRGDVRPGCLEHRLRACLANRE